MSDMTKILQGLSPEQRDLVLLRLNKLNKERGRGVQSEISRQSREKDQFPATFAQQSLWFLDQLQPGASAYNIPQVVRLEGSLNIPALKKSLDEIVRRHEALRTIFKAVEGQPVQVILPPLSISLTEIDLQDLPLDESEHRAHTLATEEALRSFDLTQGPLLRTTLLRLELENHILLLTTHHIVSDGWSMGKLVSEVGALYTAFSTGRPVELRELPIQYADYAAWQQEALQGEGLERQIDYWKKKLGGTLPLLQLPLDHPRPAVQTFRGAHQFFKLPVQLTEALRKLSQEEDVTLFMTLLAAFQALLFRYSGQEDILVGSPNANRNRPELEELIGCFSDILVLRVSLTDNPSFRELLSRVRRVTMEAYDNQDVPFTKIVEVTQPERNLSYNPLFQVMFSFLDAPEGLLELPGVTLRLIEIESGAIDFDQFLTLYWKDNELHGSLGYNADLFEAETAATMVAEFQNLLEYFVAHPDQQFAHISCLHRRPLVISATFTAEPIEESLAFWMRQLNRPSQIAFAPYNQVFQQLLHPGSLFSKNQDGVNIILLRFEDWLRFENGNGNAHQKAEQISGELVQALKAAVLNSKIPILVCVCPASRRSLADPDLKNLFSRLEAYLSDELNAINGVYLTLPAKLATLYPMASYDDEQADVVGHIPYTPAAFTALGTLLARQIDALQRLPYKVIVLDADQTLWKGACGEDGPDGLELDAPHQALQEFMLAQQKAGMLLCLCSKNAEEDVLRVFETRADMPIQRQHLVSWRINWQSKSQNLRELAEELNLGLDSFIFVDDNPVECAEVQANCPEVLTICLPKTAEQIPAFLQHVWAFDHLKRTGEDHLRTSMYQQNLQRERIRQETPTFADFLAKLDLKIHIAPLQPGQFARVAQLTQRTNQFNTTTIRRTEGELQQTCQAGQDCLTVEVSDRFGDYGLVGLVIFSLTPEVLHVDSFLLSCRVLGRGVEHQILSYLAGVAKGHSLAWVDIVLVRSNKNQPAKDFLCQVGDQFEQSSGDIRIFHLPVAVAEAAPQRLLDVSTPAASVPTNNDLQSPTRLPGHAARLIRTATELHEVDLIVEMIHSIHGTRANAKSSKVFVAPRNKVESQLAKIWSDVLRIEPIGIHDNFFELGGHSLLATQIISKVQRALQVNLSLQVFFEAPTLAQMAAHIDMAARQIQKPPIPPIQHVERNGNLPLSFAQQRLWFLNQLDPHSPAYNIPQAVRLIGPLNTPAIQYSLNEIVQRHEALRTTFQSLNGQPTQVILDHLTPPLSIIHLEMLPSTQREAEAQRLIAAEVQAPFDLERGPLLRGSLICLDPQEHILLITMHHIVTDAWSLGVFIQELAILYEAFVQGTPAPLTQLPIQYLDYAIWQQEWLQGEELARQIQYWKQRLNGAPALLELPTDRPRPAAQSFRGAQQNLVIPKSLSDALLALAQQEQATLFMIMLAAFNILLYRYSGQNDMVVGTPIANRNHPELEGMIGFFANTLAMRTQLAGDPSFLDVLKQVHQATIEAYEHQDLPFERLVSELHPERDLGYNPLFQVMFVIQNAPVPNFKLTGLTFSLIEIADEATRFDLVFHIWETPNGIGGVLTYSTDLFDPLTITKMIERFKTLLAGIVADPRKRISQLSLMTDAERQQVIEIAQTHSQNIRPRSEQIADRLKMALKKLEN